MDCKDQQLKIYRTLLWQSSIEICRKIQQSVIRKCQRIDAAVLGDTGLKSLWEEICIIADEGDGSEYDACLDTLDEFVRIAIDQSKLADWQKTGLWLMAAEGIDWIDSERMAENSCSWCLSDVVRYVRDDYLLPAAMDWTNSRIRRYNKMRYEMD